MRIRSIMIASNGRKSVLENAMTTYSLPLPRTALVKSGKRNLIGMIIAIVKVDNQHGVELLKLNGHKMLVPKSNVIKVYPKGWGVVTVSPK